MMTSNSSIKPAMNIAHENPPVAPVQHEETTNRLAPYNPTHATAREKALDLFDLSDNDVLFDLGCGDGRLLFAAMERFYDDDYLMQQHQKIFNSVVTTSQHSKHERASSTDNIINGGHEGKEVTFNDDSRKIRQSLDSQSQPLIPHMMCNASEEDDEESGELSIETPREMHPVAFNTPQKSAAPALLSPLTSPHAFPLPATPTTSNRKGFKRDFPTLHLSPIKNTAIKEIQDIPLTITASNSSDEKLPGQEESEASPRNRKWSLTFSDTRSLYSSSSHTMGLRCVGIEYDQALVEAANNQIDSFKMYESFNDADWVKKRLCIRWGCVFDEWNFPDLHGSIDGKMEQLAQHLSLLDDATAVFVYLLPEGLKKVKPLLQEAARRRREQIKELQQEEHLQQSHRKDYSHVSDITDYDFLRTTHGSDVATEKSAPSLIPPAFRVVSYMFAIPGWTPTKVDRSSKGGCPLYLYENVIEDS